MARSSRVQRAPLRSSLAIGSLIGLASLNDGDDDNKTAEEIEAEERARLAGQNVAVALELVKIGVELAMGQSDSDEPTEEPAEDFTMKM